MKKILIVILVFVCTLVYSQSNLNIYKVRYGPYNPYTEKFETDENFVDIRMTLENSVIKIYDDAHSVYIVRNHEEIRNDYQFIVSRWDGIDEKGRAVIVYMSFNKKDVESSLSIVYREYLLQYYFHN